MLPELTNRAPDAPFTPHTRLTFARRAEPWELPELMDGPCPYEEFRTVLRDLNEVNRITRAYNLTLAFLDRVLAPDSETASSLPEHGERGPRPAGWLGQEAVRSGETPVVPAPVPSQPLRILDVGSGGGDTLRAVAHWAAARNLPVELTGIDLNPHSTRAAVGFSSKDPVTANIKFLTADIFAYAPNPEPDIVLSALFTHHLTTPEIVRFLRWSEDHARLGWFINDLQRSRRAAFWFRFLPILFDWHPFIQYDGPVSLRRAFVAEDWLNMLAQARINAFSIESHPMNRLCVARIR